MKKESFIFLDTNICIYRTLAYVEPRIYLREELDCVVKKIDIFTNNNFKCQVLISNLVISELRNQSILFKEINDFCLNKLHLKRYEALSIFNKSKKSITKFLLKYGIKKDLLQKIKNYPNNLKEVNKFYLQFPNELKNLTNKKISNLKQYDKQRKISQRPNNFPEENDRKLLSQAIELLKFHDSEVYIFSNDGDFTNFKEEILKKFNIMILEVSEDIPSCEEL